VSWSTVGAALGVSAQAAQQRYQPTERQRGLVPERPAALTMAAAAGWSAVEHDGGDGAVMLQRGDCSILAVSRLRPGPGRQGTVRLSGTETGRKIGHDGCVALLGARLVSELGPVVATVTAECRAHRRRTEAMIARRKATLAADSGRRRR
jgi:hypothetical protein